MLIEESSQETADKGLHLGDLSVVRSLDLDPFCLRTTKDELICVYGVIRDFTINSFTFACLAHIDLR